MSPVEIILASIGGAAALVGSLGFLAKSLVENLLKRDIEKFKIELEAEKRLELQRFEYEFKKLSEEHNIRFARLHQRRDEAIEVLYQKLIEFQRALEAYLAFASLFGEEKADLARDKLWNAVDSFRDEAEKSRIYFSENLGHHIDQLIDAADRPTSMLMAVLENSQSGDDGQAATDAWLNAKSAIDGEMKKLRDEIEHQFRGMLGVPNEKSHGT